MLSGERIVPPATFETVAWGVFDIILYSYGAFIVGPLLFSGVAAFAVGVVDALRGAPNQLGWPVAVAGGMATVVIALAAFCVWPWSRRFVHRYEFDGRMFAYALKPQQELQSRPVTDLARVWKHRCDYRLEFIDGERLVVTFDVPRAIELYKALQAALGQAPARLS